MCAHCPANALSRMSVPQVWEYPHHAMMSGLLRAPQPRQALNFFRLAKALKQRWHVLHLHWLQYRFIMILGLVHPSTDRPYLHQL